MGIAALHPSYGLVGILAAVASPPSARRANHFVFSEMACPAPFAKIFSFASDPNQFTDSRRLVPKRGALRTSRTRGGMRWTRAAHVTNGADADGEVVWF